MSDPVCWCSSDLRCPHAIVGKLPLLWDELEKIIDDILHQFDRKEVKKFLRKDDASGKNAKFDVKESAYAQQTKPSTSHNHTFEASKNFKQTVPNPLSMRGPELRASHEMKKVLGRRKREELPNTADTRPGTANVDIESQDAESDFNYQVSDMFDARNTSRPQTQSAHVNRVKDLSRVKSADAVGTGKPKPIGAWGSPSGPLDMEAVRNKLHENDVPEPMIVDASSMTVSLLRVADILARKVLPWQAALCPRAVENLRDCRMNIVQQKHESFLQRMTKQLEDKVMEFLTKKEEEVDTWMQIELDKWHNTLMEEEDLQLKFFEDDSKRLSKRSGEQETASRDRELTFAIQMDNHEREETKEALINFRRLCRTEKRSDVRALHASIDSAQSKASAQNAVSQRDLLRRQEEAHEWLCCIADNSVTAQESEMVLKTLYDKLDSERSRALLSLQSALNAYKEQYEKIAEAITAFHGKIHQHATDYLRREQLVTRAFLFYLSGIINGEIKPHTSEQRKVNVAWEGKFITDRSMKRDHQMVTEFHICLQPFDQRVEELRSRMRVQKEHIAVKMQSILNGRDNDISKRKAKVHKKLAKHVKRICNERRVRFKDINAARLDEYNLEEKCVSTVATLVSELRSDIDQIWVKEHIKERRMYEAVAGRMERLEKSSLLIWNRHAHLAQTSSEDYQAWLEFYVKNLDKMVQENSVLNNLDMVKFRKLFTDSSRKINFDMLKPFRRFIEGAPVYDTRESIEENIVELGNRKRIALDRINEIMSPLSILLTNFMSQLQSKLGTFYDKNRNHMLLDWQTNLGRLNSDITKRILSLKSMEKDLEDSIKLTLAQNEIEACSFEQASCFRLEKFWINWRDKANEMGRQLKEDMEDFRIAKSTNRITVRATAKDREINNLIANPDMQLDKTNQQQMLTATSKDSYNYAEMGGPDDAFSDAARIKTILDEIRSEVYTEFMRKCSRGFEHLAKDYGFGKKRVVPPYMLAKVLIMAADSLWEKAKMNELCVGRVTCRGIRVFMNGLPRYGRALFCLSSALVVITSVTVSEGTRIDPNEAMAYMEQGLKRVFLSSLLAVITTYGSFGDYMLTQECIWACSSSGILPTFNPDEDDINYMLHAVTPDPVDTLNTLLNISEITADDLEYREGEKFDPVQFVEKSHDGEATKKKVNRGQAAMDKLIQSTSTTDFLSRISNVFPAADITALVTLLGRSGDTVEITYNRFWQAYYVWRKISLSMIHASTNPPGLEYMRLSDQVSVHATTKAGKRKVGACDVACVSPFEEITNTLDWITSIPGVPISLLQALCLIVRSGNVDPWMEDLKQSSRANRFVYEVSELLDAFHCKDYYHAPDQAFPASFAQGLEGVMKTLDVNGSGIVPLELLRSYIERDDPDIGNSQVTCVFWCISKFAGEVESYLQYDESAVNEKSGNPLPDSYAFERSEKEPNHVKRSIRPEFMGDIETYMKKFEDELNAIISSLPNLDAGVVVGLLSTPLNPVDANQIVSDAMRLDLSAKNIVPATCSVWLGMRQLPIARAIDNVSYVKEHTAEMKEGDIIRMLGPGFVSGFYNSLKANGNPMHNSNYIGCRVLDVRMRLEVEILSKYPVICERLHSDTSYGAGGTTINSEDHFKELVKRRLDRIDKLTVAWRSTMMNEWATSLYDSRRSRYLVRADVVRKCVKVYHEQYNNLRDAIMRERRVVMTNFTRLEDYMKDLQNSDLKKLGFHLGFLESCFESFNDSLNELIGKICIAIEKYQVQCGTIKRKALNRVKIASDRLKSELGNSCRGLIDGYSTNYAQKHFDELLYRGDRWRTNFTVFHGTIIVAKEKFVASKRALDDEVIAQICDRITLDRNRTKKLLERLTSESGLFLDSINALKLNCSEIQKDANSRIMLRVERAVRESKKLRAAGERDSQLEQHVLSEIRVVLAEARMACISIVNSIGDTCRSQLDSVEPRRVTHRNRMEERILEARQGWDDLDVLLTPLVDNYEKSVKQTMAVLRSRCLDGANQYQDEEVTLLQEEYTSERKLLVAGFRDHFTNYDLSESMIFEKFDLEVNEAVNEIRTNWGLSQPPFIKNVLGAAQDIPQEFAVKMMERITQDIKKNSDLCDDDVLLSRVELTDTFNYCLNSCGDLTKAIPEMYNDERMMQINQIKNMGTSNSMSMVRPQVIAVMDLLLSGIQIDSDFESGYTALKDSTIKKTVEINEEVGQFIDRFVDPNEPVSITATVKLCQDKLSQRRDEVKTMMDAANAHIVADHSKFEVLLKQCFADVDEWQQLTMQLINGAFDTSEEKYLAAIFPSPEGTPRVEDVMPEEIDRVEKIKNLLLANYEANLSEEDSFVVKDDVFKIKNPSNTRELQEGWVECSTEDNVVYYFNQDTGEALWDIPNLLKVPKYPDPDPAGAGYLETPRDLVIGEFSATQTVPQGVEVTAARGTKRFRGDLDVTMIITDIMAASGFIANQAIETAVEIVEVLKNPEIVRPPTPDVLPDILGRGEDDEIQDYLAQLVGKEQFEAIRRERESQAALINQRTVETTSTSDKLNMAHAIAGSILSTNANSNAINADEIGRELFQHSLLDDQELARLAIANSEMSVYTESTVSVINNREPDLVFKPPQFDQEALEREEALAKRRKEEEELFAKQVKSTASAQMQHEVHNAVLRGNLDGWLAQHLPVGVSVSNEEAVQTEFEMKQQAYRVIRERDGMTAADIFSHDLREFEQEELRKLFCNWLWEIQNKEQIFDEDIKELRNVAHTMTYSNISGCFIEYQTSWAALNDRAAATLIAIQREKDEKEAARQATLTELADDIDEMFEFFRGIGLSKTISKKAATECIVKQITTGKKLAKYWRRGWLHLSELGLDAEDAEEVEIVLKQLLLTMTDTNSLQDLNALSPNQVRNMPRTSSYESMQSANSYSHTYLDPALVTEVVEEDGDENYEGSVQQWQGETAATPNVEQTYANNHSQHALHHAYSSYHGLSKYGNYQSFANGYIEGFDDYGRKYYYNTITGISTWNLPEGNEAEGEGYDQNYQNEYADYDQYAQNYYDNIPDQGYDQNYGDQGEYKDDNELVCPTDVHFPVPRTAGLPIPVMDEVKVYSNEEGVVRQMALLSSQDKWQRHLSEIQASLSEQRGTFTHEKEDLFQKLTNRVETRLGVFIDDIKFMQRNLKQELSELESSERDLRRLFDDDNAELILAEKLAFLMEGLDKLKKTANARHVGATAQLDKFLFDWNMIEAELLQVGDMFDETVGNNLEQCRLHCEHLTKVFTYEQLKAATTVKAREMKSFRKKFSSLMRSATMEEETIRMKPRLAQEERFKEKETKCLYDRWVYQQYQLDHYAEQGFLDELPHIKENFVLEAAHPVFVPFFKGEIVPTSEADVNLGEDYVYTEEERVMSFMLTQIEMELALSDDFDSITEATKRIAIEMNQDIRKFDEREKSDTKENGSWYNKHRDTIKRHGSALHSTLHRIRQRVNEGYAILNSKIESIDFDVERAAEDEIAENSQTLNGGNSSVYEYDEYKIDLGKKK